MAKTIIIPDSEYFDDDLNEFIQIKGQTLNLEHSLISLSKWESKWEKPFLMNDKKSAAETIDYVRCMTINQNVNQYLYKVIPNDVLQSIIDYIQAPMTATWFTENERKRQLNRGRNGSVITSEIIYYWMVALQIPFECEKWHLNRLLTLIRVCEEKNQPPKKMSKSEILARNRALNDMRRKALNTTG